MPDSVWTHPWDSPGKNTGVGLPFPSPMHKSEKWKLSRSVMSDSSQPHGLPTGSSVHGIFPGKSTGVGCHCLEGSLACCNSWGRKELDTVEWLNSKSCNCSAQLWSIIQWEIYSMRLGKPLLTCLISQSNFSIHHTNLCMCMCCSCIFTFLEIIKHNTPKCCFFSFIFSIEMATHTSTNFDNILMLIDMTVVAIIIQ